MTAVKWISSLCLLICWHAGMGQENASIREITGSFRFRNDIFTYKCQVARNGATLETRKITNTASPDTSLRASLSSIGSTVISQLKQWGASANDSLIERSSSINNNVSSLYLQLDSIKNYLQSVNTRLDSLKAHAVNDSIQKIIISFQQQVAQAMTSSDKLSKGQPVSPNIDWSVTALKGALYQQLIPNSPSLLLSDEDLNTLSLEIFYKGEVVRDLTDNPPVTANMTLLNDHINAYVEDVPVVETITDNEHLRMVNERDGSLVQDPITGRNDSILWHRLDKAIQPFKSLGKGRDWARYYTEDIPISLPVSKVQVEFDKGTIKNLIASFSCNKIYKAPKDIDFRNNMPISVSGKFDNDFFSGYRIFAYNPKFIQKAFNKALQDTLPPHIKIDPGYGYDHDVYFKIDELISYSITLENDKEDYSPADKTYILTPLQPVATLTKQSRSQVLTVKAFTDFMGVNKEASNGLIQFEANLNANFLTRRLQKFLFFKQKYTYQGFITQANVNAMVTKIEDNNKFFNLGPEAIDSNRLLQGKKAFLVSPIDLYRYKSNAIDFSVTLWKLNIPQVKSNVHLNGRFGISRSSVVDSFALSGTSLAKSDVANQRMITFSETNLSAEYEFTPDSDHGFYVGFGWTWLGVMSEDVRKAERYKGRVNTFYIGGFLATGSNSKVFFRWRLNYQAGNSNLNFNQVQLGYLVDIFAAK